MWGASEDNKHIKENTPKCNTITEHRERVNIKVRGQHNTCLLDIEAIHHKCVPPKAVDHTLFLSSATYIATHFKQAKYLTG
jgi:hypothetical protein